jgi:hypothetical protein
MVDGTLLEQVMQLDESARRELRDALDESLPEHVSPQVVALLKERIAEADANPDDYLSLDEFRRQIAKRRAPRTA